MCIIYSEFERHQGGVIGKDSSSDFKKVDESFTLSRETVYDVLVMVGDRSLEEEREVC